jgi:threonine/homoserine/homoserine lactone efflux protein
VRVTDLWTSLIPLIVGTAVLPVQVTITILILRAPGGRRTAAAWVGGMTLVRLVQGVLFLAILDIAAQGHDGEDGGVIASALLFLVAVLFYLGALRKATKQPDEDAPPPGWMTKIASITPRRAFLLGATLVGVSPKLWALMLGALAAIIEAALPATETAVVFLVFVVLAQSLHLAAILGAIVAPARAEVLLARIGDGLERHNRTIMIALGLVFGTWVLVKALTGLGVI